MRKLIFNQYEFDLPDAEQHLELQISSPKEHGDFARFLRDCNIGLSKQNDQYVKRTLRELDRGRSVESSLKKFSGLDIPNLCTFPIIVFNDDWDDLQLAIDAGHYFIAYHWYTTA